MHALVNFFKIGGQQEHNAAHLQPSFHTDLTETDGIMCDFENTKAIYCHAYRITA